jgi:ubiquinone/menaquinone biosynthesis C-methylase UbiE
MNQRTAAPPHVFGEHSEHTSQQHRLLSLAYDPMTTERLVQAGVAPGWRCLEVGAGNGSVATWLARRVGPDGAVVATEIRPEHVASAENLKVIHHDIACDPLPEAEFDLVHARQVLPLLPERLAVLDRLVRALKPGGVLQLDDFDITDNPPLLTPDPAARELYRTFTETKIQLMTRAGVDVAWGRNAAEAMRRAGLIDIDPQLRRELWVRESPGLRLAANHTRHLRDQFVKEGMTDRQLADIRTLLAHPDFRAGSYAIYSVQGHRP